MKTDEELLGYIKQRDEKLLAADPANRVYLDELQRRSDVYAAHVATMQITPSIAVWAMAMAKAHGPYVMMTHFITDWITALLIIRYGEEPEAERSTDPNFKGWPNSFSEIDVARASDLLEGRKWTPMIIPCRRVFQ